MLKEYKGLILDEFQSLAMDALDKNRNVLCCAPTGSGKTLLAEYIIEKTMDNNDGEIIYTAPIKALSNQKYRDFKEIYGKENVGIITGDVVVNPDAPLIMMTTEIYRNIMYDDPLKLSKIKYVVFDEVHYLEDDRRGTVWEESLMLSPENIRFLCLSATVSNADQIGSWLSDIRGVKTEVIFHNVRPVPLKIGFFVKNIGYFKDKQLFRAINAAKQSLKQKNKKRGRKEYNVLDYLMNHNYLPALYFCFSRKMCEVIADRVSGYPLLTREESQEAHDFFSNYIKENQLENFKSATDLLDKVQSGVAYHHAGLLHQLKEAIEILFSKGLIKVLFATETFALGINMPARTVVFSSLEKNDGICFRYLKNYEFQQMAGRAGRRGIDEEGFVVNMIEPKYCNYEETKNTVFGKLESVSSRFGFSYSSLMNLYERQTIDEVKQLAKLSLASYQKNSFTDELDSKIEKLKAELENTSCRTGKGSLTSNIRVFRELTNKLQDLKSEIDVAKTKMRKAKDYKKRELNHKLIKDIAFQIKTVKKSLSKNQCKKCFQGSKCMFMMDKLVSLERRKKNVGNKMLDTIDRKFAFLTKLGYLDDTGLLPRGEFASDIFGYEIQATEMYFEGYLNKLQPVEILAVLSTISFEKRRDEVGKIRIVQYRKPVYEFIEKIERIKKIEKSVMKEEIIMQPDPGFVDPIVVWASGISFEDFSGRFVQFAEGDLIRQLRQTIDLIRQLKRALHKDTHTKAILDNCIELINRDVVDAEKFL